MKIEDVDAVITRVKAKRDRIEGEYPQEFDDVLDRLDILRDTVILCGLTVYQKIGFLQYEYPTSYAVAMACACACIERESPSMANRMLTDESINLALRLSKHYLECGEG